MIKVLVPYLPRAAALVPYLERIDIEHWYTNFGPLVRELERRINETFFDGKAYVVALSSGTAALELGVKALNDYREDACVAVPAWTFPATLLACLPEVDSYVCTDVNPRTWTMLPEHVPAHARFVMPVASLGAPTSAALWQVFRNDRHVLIDAAGAIGQQDVAPGVHVAFSLHATKVLPAGEGGLFVTLDEELAQCVRELSNFGIKDGVPEDDRGTNAKMSEYHAAVALASLDEWGYIQDCRSFLEDRYIRDLPRSVKRQERPPGGVYSTLSVILPEGSRSVESVRIALQSQGIQTRRWYYPTPWVTTLEDKPMTKTLLERSLGLPYHMGLSNEDVNSVCNELGEILK